MRVIVMFRTKHHGFSLIETIVTIVVLAIALTGITLAIQQGTGSSSTASVEVRATALAQAYLDEILGKRFDERSANRGVPPCRDPVIAPGTLRDCTLEVNFGSEGGEGTNRSRFDDVDDYHNLDEGDGQGTPLQDAEGVTRDEYENFRVTVDVRYIHVLLVSDEEYQLSASAMNDEDIDDNYDAKLITVTVYYRGIPEGLMFSAYKANF